MESAGDYFFLAGKIALRYAQDNLGVKKASAPSKNPLNCPIMSFAQEIKIISPTFQISGTLVILCPKERERKIEREREREKERARARPRARIRVRARARAGKGKRKGQGKGQGKRKGQRKGQGKGQGKRKGQRKGQERERERERKRQYESAGDYIPKPPGPK